ncbi:nucleoside triphosphate pyrophosphohydrolase [Eubacteriales bacterium OttesenSCG-928-K08]|nr:nucleoside triphosphate pyrophosphohydrolase [Eubacteriales bacterium OttesenSCG-928-K08]
MFPLTIIALSTPNSISQSGLEACAKANKLFVQTAQTPCMQPLLQKNICFETMDELYECANDFDELNSAITERLIKSCANCPTAYAVPGGLTKNVSTLAELARASGVDVEFVAGAGYAQAAATAAGLFADALTTCAANALPELIDTRNFLFIEELDTFLRAGEVKLLLLEHYPNAFELYFCRMGESGEYNTKRIKLFELDRQADYHATTVILLPPVKMLELERFGYRELEDVTRQLRAPGGCPWDAEQTHESLKKALIEECYEVLDAIDQQDDDALCEELGDVLLQCVFHAQIASGQGRFNEKDMTTGIVNKLIYRHPHVFASGQAKTSGEVIEKWEELKKKEKHFETQTQVLEAVPKNLPALMRADKIQKKAAQVGFDWENAMEALPKLREELAELDAALFGEGDPAEEFGDLLFAAVNVARLLGFDAEQLLQQANAKFTERFAKMEALASSNDKKLSDLTLDEQNNLWEAVKSQEIRQK